MRYGGKKKRGGRLESRHFTSKMDERRKGETTNEKTEGKAGWIEME